MRCCFVQTHCETVSPMLGHCPQHQVLLLLPLSPQVATLLMNPHDVCGVSDVCPLVLCLASVLEGKIHNVEEFLRNKEEIPQE